MLGSVDMETFKNGLPLSQKKYPLNDARRATVSWLVAI